LALSERVSFRRADSVRARSRFSAEDDFKRVGAALELARGGAGLIEIGKSFPNLTDPAATRRRGWMIAFKASSFSAADHPVGGDESTRLMVSNCRLRGSATA